MEVAMFIDSIWLIITMAVVAFIILIIKTQERKMNKGGRWPRKDYTPEEVSYLKFIGSKIKRRRMQLGYTQTEVGKLILTSFQQVQKYESGKNIINNIKLERLRNALSIPKHRIGFLTNKYNSKTDIAKEEYADNPTVSFEMKDGELVVKGNPFNEKTSN